MAAESRPLTAVSSIATWLQHPDRGPLIREMLAQGGFDESAVSEYGSARMAPFHNLIPSVATAAQLAASLAFLLSDDGVNINGAILPSDGGVQ
jgi:hypothetical protein